MTARSKPNQTQTQKKRNRSAPPAAGGFRFRLPVFSPQRLPTSLRLRQPSRLHNGPGTALPPAWPPDTQRPESLEMSRARKVRDREDRVRVQDLLFSRERGTLEPATQQVRQRQAPRVLHTK